jgi:hypothetical protein
MKIWDQFYPERSLVHSPNALIYLLMRRVNELGMTGSKEDIGINNSNKVIRLREFLYHFATKVYMGK